MTTYIDYTDDIRLKFDKLVESLDLDVLSSPTLIEQALLVEQSLSDNK